MLQEAKTGYSFICRIRIREMFSDIPQGRYADTDGDKLSGARCERRAGECDTRS